jgi:hypothetical protein
MQRYPCPLRKRSLCRPAEADSDAAGILRFREYSWYPYFFPFNPRYFIDGT